MEDQHYCSVCSRSAGQHSEDCPCGCGESFLMPLCCPGCDCGSFEDAHAELLDSPKEHPDQYQCFCGNCGCHVCECD